MIPLVTVAQVKIPRAVFDSYFFMSYSQTISNTVSSAFKKKLNLNIVHHLLLQATIIFLQNYYNAS